MKILIGMFLIGMVLTACQSSGEQGDSKDAEVFEKMVILEEDVSEVDVLNNEFKRR